MLIRGDYKKLCKQLNEFGFINYQEFLNSGLWKEFRAVLYKRDKPTRCSICKKKSPYFSLHHRTYKRILDPKNVVWVCDVCHKSIHDKKEKSIHFETDRLLLEINGTKNKKQRVGGLDIIPSSGLPATLHHSIHASGLVNKVRNGESVEECVSSYYSRKLRKMDELMIGLLEQNRENVLKYLSTFKTN